LLLNCNKEDDKRETSLRTQEGFCSKSRVDMALSEMVYENTIYTL